jgi:hypothetical protein
MCTSGESWAINESPNFHLTRCLPSPLNSRVTARSKRQTRWRNTVNLVCGRGLVIPQTPVPQEKNNQLALWRYPYRYSAGHEYVDPGERCIRQSPPSPILAAQRVDTGKILPVSMGIQHMTMHLVATTEGTGKISIKISILVIHHSFAQ